MPKAIAPTDRNLHSDQIRSFVNGSTTPTYINTSVIPQVISLVDFPNVSARSDTVNETVKKSNASHVQPKNATRKNIHCLKLSNPSSVNGFSTYKSDSQQCLKDRIRLR
jgi:hypothetical protein